MPSALALVLHAHQPVDNFDSVVEQAFETAYLPFLDRFEPRSALRAGLHFSGFLLDWIARHHPPYIARLRRLADAQRIELLGGGYYEPILAALREPDRQAQLRRLSHRLAELFGAPPRGAWLAERVWQPDVAASLARAGLRYTVLDDTHFLLNGLSQPQTWSPFWTEFQDGSLQVAASDHFLRRAIPFLPEDQAIAYLRAAPCPPDQPPPLLVMGDDLEKFGSWPHTFEHVYAQGWLDRFFDRLEAERENISTVLLGDFLRRYPARRRIYLPTASYEEMMMWALPPAVARRLDALRQSPPASDLAACRPFLTGAVWHNFLARYSEASHLHQRALDLSRRCQSLSSRRARSAAAPASVSASASASVADASGTGPLSVTDLDAVDADASAAVAAANSTFARAKIAFPSAAAAASGSSVSAIAPATHPTVLLAEAREHLLASQANDVYWHGLFGGIYSPHLRNVAYRHLIAADRRLAALEPPRPFRRHDFELQGGRQLELRSPALRLALNPAEGGTLTEIEFLPAEANLTHSITRRPERYHDEIRRHLSGHGIAPLAAADSSSAADSSAAPDASALAAALLYDPYLRAGLRLYLFPESREYQHYSRLALDEAVEWSAAPYAASLPRLDAGAIHLRLHRRGALGPAALAVTKRLALSLARPEIRIELQLAPAAALAGWRLGLEFVVNLLAPRADDRWLASGDTRLPLDFAGELAAASIAWHDGWRRFRARFDAPGARWWLQPLFTVSQSEQGFERLYQGSAALAVWPAAARAHVAIALDSWPESA